MFCCSVLLREAVGTVCSDFLLFAKQTCFHETEKQNTICYLNTLQQLPKLMIRPQHGEKNAVCVMITTRYMYEFMIL